MSVRVVVGMSGGVDSSVAAALLVEQGYEVTGVFVEAYNGPGCRTNEDRRDALKVASKLGIGFEVLDFTKEYKRRVVEYFLSEYQAGRTPNPDVVCNSEVKFGLLLSWAREKGYDQLATGHYARVTQTRRPANPRMRVWLQRPKDLDKDQSYFLWRVGGEKLRHVLFPLGEMTKREVREKARALGLPNADKPDSMGVCMMGELNVREWLVARLGERPGEVVWNGRVIGRHRGLWLSTVGQRGGWETDPSAKSAKMPVLYVVGKDTEHNRLIVGEREECYEKELSMMNYELRMGEDELCKLGEEKRLFVRIRNMGELYEMERFEIRDSRFEIVTAKAVFAPAPGQSAVLYVRGGKDKSEVVVGGGIIVV